MDLLSYVLPEQTESTIGDLVKMTGPEAAAFCQLDFL